MFRTFNYKDVISELDGNDIKLDVIIQVLDMVVIKLYQLCLLYNL